MTETIVHNQYEHYFEIAESSVRYKYSIDLNHGEIIRVALPTEVKHQVRQSQEVTHINNLF